MRRNDLFEIILKFYGVYMLLNALSQVIIALLTFLPEYERISNGRISILALLFPSLIGFAVYSFFGYFLVFRSRTLIARVFRKDPDVELTWQVSKRTVLQMAMIVLGGMFLLSNISEVGSQLLWLWQIISSDMEPRPGTIPELIWTCTMVLLGYAIITASPKIAAYLSGKIPDDTAKNYKPAIQKVIGVKRKVYKPKVVRPKGAAEVVVEK